MASRAIFLFELFKTRFTFEYETPSKELFP
jgi:hypothetical protein